MNILAPSQLEEAPAAALRGAYRGRLVRLLRLRFAHGDQLNDEGRALVDDAIVRSYRDLAAIGDGERAGEMVKMWREAFARPGGRVTEGGSP